VPAAFEPDVAQKGIEDCKTDIAPHFEMQPVGPVPIGHQMQDFHWVCWKAPSGSGRLQSGLPLLAGAQVPGHGAFTEGALAKATGA
jgi:hypothetical protein